MASASAPLLTDEERTELKTAHDAAIQANPGLATQQKALEEQLQAIHKQINDAMIKEIDPKVAPIIAKLEAAKPHHHEDSEGRLPLNNS